MRSFISNIIDSRNDITMPRRAPKSLNERYGFILSAIGLSADLIALGTFGFVLINNTDPTTPISIALWIGILSIVPLTYFWGLVAWLANRKFGKPMRSILAVGLCLMPFFILWGAVIMAEYFRVSRNLMINGVPQYAVTTDSRTNGVIGAIIIQVMLGSIIYAVIRLWNGLLASSVSNQ